jgi:replicative DNA helicase
MANDTLGGALEQNILCALCWNDELASQIVFQLEARHFSTRHYQKIADVALGHYNRYKKPIGPHLPDYLEDDIRRSNGELFEFAIRDMQNIRGIIQVDFVKQELSKWIELRELTRGVELASDALQSGDLDGAKEILSERASHDKSLSAGILLSDHKQSLSFLEEQDKLDRFTCGIDALDDRGVSPSRGTQFLFIAPPKAGKSWFLIHVGKRALLAGHSVCHISLENSEKLTSQRYIQSFFSMTVREASTLSVPMFERDKSGHYLGSETVENVTPRLLDTSARQEVIKKMEILKRKKPLYIKGFPSGSLTVGQLEGYLDWMAATHNFIPDILLVDYPDLMSIDSRNRRTDTGRIFVELRGQAVRRNHALVTVTQGNRTSADVKVIKGTHVSEDYSKIMTADYIITYNQTDKEHDRGLARLWVEGSRGAAQGFMALISQTYANGQFCLDSVPFSTKQIAGKKNANSTGKD